MYHTDDFLLSYEAYHLAPSRPTKHQGRTNRAVPIAARRHGVVHRTATVSTGGAAAPRVASTPPPPPPPQLSLDGLGALAFGA